MNMLGRAFPGIYEKRFYKRICEILAFIIYALALMLIFGLLSSTHNSGNTIGDSKGYELAEKVNSGIIHREYSTNNTILTVSKERVDDFREAIEKKDKKKALELARPVIEKAWRMKGIEAVEVE